MLTKKIACPSCSAGLKIADTLPAGKVIKCPKCGVGFPVPVGNDRQLTPPSPLGEEERREGAVERNSFRSAPERNEFRSTTAHPHPLSPKRRGADQAEQVEDRPAVRKKRRRKRKPARNTPLVLGLIIGGFVLLIGVGVAVAVVYWPTGKKFQTVDEGNSAKAGPVGSAPGDESGPTVAVTPQFAAGRKVFETNNCARCHTIGGSSPGGFEGPPGGSPGMGRARGPDLATVGRDPAHTVDWVMEQVRNPKAHKPDSRMPSYQGRIKDDDLRALAEYLASLK